MFRRRAERECKHACIAIGVTVLRGYFQYTAVGGLGSSVKLLVPIVLTSAV
jgi:hypothetical protein